MNKVSIRRSFLNKSMINSVLLLIFLCITTSAKGGDQSQETKNNSATQKQMLQTSTPRSPSATLAISYLRQLSNEATEVIEVLEDLKRESETWYLYFPPLTTNDDGRALATSIESINVYTRYAEKTRPNERSIDSRFRRIGDQLRDFQQQIISDNPVMPETLKNKLDKDIKQQMQEAKELFLTYKNDRETIETLVAKGSKQLLSDISLKEAIQNHKAELASIRATKISKVEKEEYERHTDELVRLAQDIEKLKQEKIRDEQERKKRQLAFDLIEAQVSDPTIQVQFGPFIEKGHRTPSLEAKGKWREQNGPASPLSYAYLAQVGVFDDLKVFVAVGCSRRIQDNKMIAPTNDRTIWPYPQNEREWAVYQQRFDLFKKLAPEMKNKGLLAP